MAVPARGTITFSVVNQAGVPAGGVSAVALNITSTDDSQAGYVTAYPAGSSRPNASTLNHSAAQTKAVLTMVRVGTAGMVSLYNGSGGSVHLLADIEGYIRTGIDPAAGSYVARDPQRVLDTRTAVGGHPGALAPGETTTLTVPPSASLPAGTAAALATITVTGATSGGHLTIFPAGYDEPLTSNLNFTSGETVANLAVVPVDGGGRLRIHNASTSAVQVIVDVAGSSVVRP